MTPGGGSRARPMYPIRGGEGGQERRGADGVHLGEMIAKGIKIMSIASKKTIAKKMTITKSLR